MEWNKEYGGDSAEDGVILIHYGGRCEPPQGGSKTSF